MRKTLWRALGASWIAAAMVLAAPTALSASKKTPTPAAEKSSSKEKASDKTKTEKVNLNTADEKDIAAAKGVGEKLAKELVKNRPYKTWDDVAKVKGVGSGKKLDSLKKVLKLSEGVASAKEETPGKTEKKSKKSSSKGEEAATSGGTSAAAGGAAAGGAAGGSAATGKASAAGESSSSKKSSSSSSSSSEKSAASKLAPGERININTASAEELDRLPEIGPVKAKAIVDYREANGKFATIEDVMKVSGIKEGTFAKIKDHITVK